MKPVKDDAPTRVLMGGLRVTIDTRRFVELFRCEDGSYLWLLSRPDGAKQLHTELRVSAEAFAAMTDLIMANEAAPVGKARRAVARDE